MNAGITAEELDDLAWALADAFPEVAVNLSGAQDFWEAKATQLLPVINKLRDKARAEGRGVPSDNFGELWDSISHEPGCGWETGPYCTCGADPGRAEGAVDDPGS